MSDAHVLELDALDSLRTGLFRFRAEAEEALAGALQSAASVTNEVAKREELGRAEVRRWEEKVATAESALRHCRGQEDANCSGLETELAIARRGLERKVEILRAVRVIKLLVEEAGQDFARSAQRMRGALSEHVDPATTKLQAWSGILETYAVGSVPSGSVSTSAVRQPASRGGWGTAGGAAAATLGGLMATAACGSTLSGELGTDREWRSATLDSTSHGFSWARWNVGRTTMILTDASARAGADTAFDAASLDAVAAAVGAGTAMRTAIVYGVSSGRVFLYQRIEPNAQWSLSKEPEHFTQLLDAAAHEPERVMPTPVITVIPLSIVELPNSVATDSSDSVQPDSFDDVARAWRIWENDVRSAAGCGAGRDFFRLLDDVDGLHTNVQGVYDSLYGDDPIRVEPSNSNRYRVIGGSRRVLAAQQLGLDEIPVVIVSLDAT